MSAFSTLYGDGAGGLATRLTEIAEDAHRAGTYADGEYIPQMSREFELRLAFSGAGAVSARLEQLKSRIARLDGGEDGLRLVQHAIDNLEGGRRTLQEGVRIEDDALRNAGAVIDAIAIGTAGTMFRQAAAGVQGIADIAKLESVGVDDLYLAITGERG